MFVKSILTAAALAAGVNMASAADISGAGATFPFPIYAKWADAYKKDTGNGLNYQSIGSGAGIKQIRAKTVTFGATDAPLKAEELQKDGLAQWPMVMGGIVAVVNLDGVKPGDFHIDGPTLAKVYLGEITNWSDPALKALNPSLSLPNLPIVPVHRADGSGTTFNFTYYLGEVSPEWKDKVGVATTVDWPGGIGAKGNDGVANNVATTKGAIGYVEYAYAKQNKMTYALLTNRAGGTVAPSAESFQAAAANADWAKADSYYLILTDQPGSKSWPITGASFILLYKQPSDPTAVREALKFFAWAYKDGAQMAEELDYVPLPASLIAQVKKTWATEITAGGHPVWTGG
ncbi:MAG TPA: phosphate ABC transporter substrate-binding protein PstS [Steroidobacteraceae bacterium]|nr:phosphate ABC transporter substrate-binding protein PstS [Steroidobacteraceae bacterium]